MNLMSLEEWFTNQKIMRPLTSPEWTYAEVSQLYKIEYQRLYVFNDGPDYLAQYASRKQCYYY